MTLRNALAWSASVVLSAVTVTAAVDVRLIDAVRTGKAETVRALLKQRLDVNATQPDGATALHWAVHLDDLNTADLLLRSGARADAANDVGATPLYLACINRNPKMVNRLLSAGANPNATLLGGESVLMMCAQSGDAESVKALLIRGANVNAKESAHGQTALMWAVSEQHADVVEALLEAGADVRARSTSYTQLVTSQGQSLDKLTDPTYTVEKGGSTPLLFAARVGDVASAGHLLAAGADINDRLANGTSALILAAHSGHGPLAAMLLEKGANPNDAAVGYTALHAAVLRSDLALVKALLAHGANPNLTITKPTPNRRQGQDFELQPALVGATPYFLAARYLETDIMRALAAGGADIRSPLPNGTTPLMAAAGTGASAQNSRRGVSGEDGGIVEPESRVVEAVKVALELGGDVNGTNQAGDSALFGAANLGYDQVVQLLLDNGAQLNLRNKRGLTALGSLIARDEAAAAVVFSGGNPVAKAPPSTLALLRKLGAEQ
jgi:ankyrin repeat protein